MRRIFQLTVSVFFVSMVFSCDKGFDDLNTSKTGATKIDPAIILNDAIINISNNTLIYEIGIVQQIITPFSGVLTGANYNQDNRNATDNNWDKYYIDVIRNTRDVIALTEGLPERENLKNMARILQAFSFMVLTDSYGAVPYTNGGNGYYSEVFFPEYDSQESIYPKIISELEQATSGLNTSGKTETGEILYGGDIDKWRKFGNSLLLRAGMRLSKVDPAQAQAIVKKAFDGGVITSNEDNAVIRHDNNYQNPISTTLNGTEAANFYLAKAFVDELKYTNDPRLSSIAVRYIGAISGPTQTADKTSSAPEDQIGMPIGYDNGSIGAVATADGLESFYAYSQADRKRVAGLTAPWFILTAGQTNLLLAEARFRGWISIGTTEKYFKDGVRASLEKMAEYGDGSAISQDDQDAYLGSITLTSGNELNQINTQYWISSFLNGPEAFANFRRSGYPQLEANPYPGREVPFINRLTYPDSELSVNQENVATAINQQGPDDLGTKVWWDK